MIEIKGNGNIVSREIEVSSFIRLHLSGKGLIELHQSDDEKVVVETDENLQEYFNIVNSGRTLYVSAEGEIKRPAYTQCMIKVYLRQIETLYVRNEGADVVCPEELFLPGPLEIKIQSLGNTQLFISSPSVKILSQCQGNVILKGRCRYVEIKNQSQGDFDASELLAEDLTIKNMAQGNVKLNASNSIKITHMGQGFIH